MKWEFLGQHCTVKTGKLDANASSENGQYPFFTCAVSPLKIDTYAFDCEAILIAGNGDLNAKHYTGKFNAYQRTYVLSDFSNFLYPRYGYYFLDNYLDTLRGNSVGGVIKYIKLGMLTEAKIPLPLLEEQKRIAAILDKAYSIRQKRQQNLENADALIKSIFLDMFGDPVTNPKGWEIKQLAEVANISSGVTKGKRYTKKELVTLPYMRVANVQDGYIDLSEVKEIEISTDEVNKYLLRKGDILLTEGGDPDKLGRGAVWNEEIENCIHQNHIFKIRITDHHLSPKYLSMLIGSPHGKTYFLRAAKQTTGIASINKSQLSQLPIYIPKIQLQQKFAEMVIQIELQKTKQQEHLHEADQVFKALQQQFFGL